MKVVRDLLQMYNRLEQSNEPAALATVVEVQGSHYSPMGATMLISESGKTAGLVSSGCLLAELIENARDVIKDNRPKLMKFDTTSDDDLLLGSGMGCGGTISILLESTKSDSAMQYMCMLAQCEKLRNHTSVATAYATEGDVGISIGDRFFLAHDQTEPGDNNLRNVDSLVQADLKAVQSSTVSTNKVYTLPNGTVSLFIEYIRPSHSIAIFGASDDVIPVCKFASILGWQITIIDPRADLLTSDRFPAASELITAHPNNPRCFGSIDNFDAAVVMTHNFLRDLELLPYLLKSKLRYVGLLGAKKRVDKLIAELHADIPRKSLNKFYAPVGLDVGAESPTEIALSIVTEIQTVLSGKAGRSLREKRSINFERLALQSQRILPTEGVK